MLYATTILLWGELTSIPHLLQGNVPLQDEVNRLNGELREARQKIRNLELQVEGLKANARKAAQALLDV